MEHDDLDEDNRERHDSARGTATHNGITPRTGEHNFPAVPRFLLRSFSFLLIGPKFDRSKKKES